jgi:S1-C subfamily serine protease
VLIAVKCFGGNSRGGRGTGVLIDSHRVLTAHHVVDCGKGFASVTVKVLSSGKVFPVTVLTNDKKADLATLGTQDLAEFADVITLNVGRPDRQGEETLCFSSAVPYPDYRCGIFERYRISTAGDLVFGGHIEPGNSGSGLYDRHGLLVGIVVHRRNARNGEVVGGNATSVWRHIEILGL